VFSRLRLVLVVLAAACLVASGVLLLSPITRFDGTECGSLVSHRVLQPGRYNGALPAGCDASALHLRSTEFWIFAALSIALVLAALAAFWRARGTRTRTGHENVAG